jgi:spore coat protein CotH
VPATGVSAPAPSLDAGITPPVKPEITAEPLDDATYIFDPSQVRTYNLIVAENDLTIIDANPSAEMYIPATLEFEGKTYGPYRMRYKGSAGAWDPPCTLLGAQLASAKGGKCSIKVDFDLNNDATFFGLKKLNFHSMNQDPSELRERLAYGLFRDMGIAAPRCSHARVTINGRLEGLFALVEEVDGRFARAHFGDGGKGNVYKEVWPTYNDPSVYAAALVTNEKQNPNVQRMLDFKAAVDTSEQSFASFIDRDYMTRYIAIDRVIVNDDGIFHFWCDPIAQGNNTGPWGNHNYFWYESDKQNRFWLIPWDLDFALGARTDVKVIPEWTVDAQCVCGYDMNGIQRPASCDTVVQYFRGWLDDYNRQIDAFLVGPFQRERVNAKLDTWAAQIQAVVAEAAGRNRAPTLATWKQAIANLKVTLDSERDHRGHGN